MATTNGNRKILDLKRWEFCTPAPVATAAGAFISSSRHYRQQQLYVTSATVHHLYSPLEDAWVQIPSGALAGTFAAGACGTATAIGPSGTATGGSTSTINTNLTLARDLRGYSIHITGGPNAGVTLAISSNTIGANGVVTVPTQASAFTASTTYRLITPRWYVLNAITAAGTTTANVFRFYDFATNTWASAETGATDGIAPAAVIGTDSKLVATPSWQGTDYRAFATNTATALTTSAAWTTAPDATSVYNIEGNDNFIYYMGSGAVTLYRYSISAGTWTTITPGVARAAAPGAGMSGHWAWESTDSAWTNESAIISGRRIYSFRGGASAVLDYYDIASNTWVNGVTYAPAAETFTTGSKYVYLNDAIYVQKEATGRWLRLNLVTSEQDGWSTMTYTQGAAVLGDTAFDVHYTDGATEIDYIHMVLNTSTVMLRAMVI